MSDDNPKSFWFNLGCGLGACVTAFVFATGMALCQWHTIARAIHHLKDWQTAIVGFFATALAIATVVWLHLQIGESARQHEDKRERREFAQNAFLPFALTDLRAYAEGCVNALRVLGPMTPPYTRVLFPAGWTPPSLPALPRHAVDSLISSIESAELGAREAMRDALRQLQIQHARLSDGLLNVAPGSTVIVTQRDVSERIVEALDLFQRFNAMFEYARGRAPTISTQLTATDLATAAFFQNVEELDYPLVHEVIAQRYT